MHPMTLWKDLCAVSGFPSPTHVFILTHHLGLRYPSWATLDPGETCYHQKIWNKCAKTLSWFGPHSTISFVSCHKPQSFSTVSQGLVCFETKVVLKQPPSGKWDPDWKVELDLLFWNTWNSMRLLKHFGTQHPALQPETPTTSQPSTNCAGEIFTWSGNEPAADVLWATEEITWCKLWWDVM